MTRNVFAGADFGFRSDSCALAVVEARPGGVLSLVALEEQRPKRGAPLRPSAVVGDFADVLREHGIRRVMSDGHYREAIVELLKERSIHLDSAPEGASGKAQTYIHMRTLVNEGRLKIPRHVKLIAQLKALICRPTSGGGLSITSPRHAGGHGDLVSALVLAVWSAKRNRSEPKPGYGGSFTPGVDIYDQSAGFESVGRERYRGNN